MKKTNFRYLSSKCKKHVVYRKFLSYGYIVVMPILMVVLSIKPILFFLITLVIAHIFLFDLLKDKVLHLKSFYGDEIKNLTIKNRLQIEINILLISLSSLVMVCPIPYHPILIVIIIVMFLLTFLFTKLYFIKKIYIKKKI